MWLMLGVHALAWDLDASVVTEEPVVDVAVSSDRGAWLTGTEAVVRGASGAVQHRVTTDASALELVDPDGDGVPGVLVLCGPSGLDQLVLADGSRATLTESPCTAALSLRGGLLTQSGAGLVYWSGVGGDVLAESEVLDAGVRGADLLASSDTGRDDGIAVGRTGSSSLLWLEGRDPGVDVPVAGALTGLATDPDGFIAYATTTEAGKLVNAAPSADLRLPPGGFLASGDISGDGKVDLVSTTATGVGVWDGAWYVPHSVGAMSRIAVAPDSTCAPAAAGGSAGGLLLTPVGCLDDADGDGTTSEAGDCHDGDDAIGPHAVELCDGVDNNCDRLLDNAGVALGATLDADEGQELSFPLGPACDGGSLLDTVVRATDTDDLECDVRIEEDRLFCRVGDDGTYTLRISQAGETEQDFPFTVHNLPPTLAQGAELTVPTSGSIQLRADDYDADDVIFEVVDGPDWFVLDPDGVVVNPAPAERQWDARIRMDDQDGGVTEADVVLIGLDPPSSCVTVSCASAEGAPWMGLLALLWARRRRRS